MSQPTELPICFVMMPFGGSFDEEYRTTIGPAVRDAGLLPIRGDDIQTPSPIMRDVWDLIRRSTVLLADLRGKNPNVFYELGLAHALAKPVVLLAAEREDVPFDLRSLRCVYCSTSVDSAALVAALAAAGAAPRESVLPLFLHTINAATALTWEQTQILEELARRNMLKPVLDRLRGPDTKSMSDSPAVGALEGMAIVGHYHSLGVKPKVLADYLAWRYGFQPAFVELTITRLKQKHDDASPA